MNIKNFYTFGTGKKSVKILFKKFGLNTRLNLLNIKLKHQNKIINKLNTNNLTGKDLKVKILTFRSFYQQINYNKSKLKNGKSLQKKTFSKKKIT
jgi:hypothetical protein